MQVTLTFTHDPLAIPAPEFPLSVDSEVGAIVDFFGIVRGTEAGMPIEGLTYEAYLPMAEKELVKKALSLGHRLFLDGSIERAEAVNKTIIQNAFQAFIDHGYLAVRDTKLDLADGMASREAFTAVAEGIRAWIPGRSA